MLVKSVCCSAPVYPNAIEETNVCGQCGKRLGANPYNNPFIDIQGDVETDYEKEMLNDTH